MKIKFAIVTFTILMTGSLLGNFIFFTDAPEGVRIEAKCGGTPTGFVVPNMKAIEGRPYNAPAFGQNCTWIATALGADRSNFTASLTTTNNFEEVRTTSNGLEFRRGKEERMHLPGLFQGGQPATMLTGVTYFIYATGDMSGINHYRVTNGTPNPVNILFRIESPCGITGPFNVPKQGYMNVPAGEQRAWHASCPLLDMNAEIILPSGLARRAYWQGPLNESGNWRIIAKDGNYVFEKQP